MTRLQKYLIWIIFCLSLVEIYYHNKQRKQIASILLRLDSLEHPKYLTNGRGWLEFDSVEKLTMDDTTWTQPTRPIWSGTKKKHKPKPEISKDHITLDLIPPNSSIPYLKTHLAEDSLYTIQLEEYTKAKVGFGISTPVSRMIYGNPETYSNPIVYGLPNSTHFNCNCFPIVNYADSPADHFNFGIRYQWSWYPNGGDIISRVLSRIPEDSMKAWIGKETWDYLDSLDHNK